MLCLLFSTVNSILYCFIVAHGFFKKKLENILDICEENILKSIKHTFSNNSVSWLQLVGSDLIENSLEGNKAHGDSSPFQQCKPCAVCLFPENIVLHKS